MDLKDYILIGGGLLLCAVLLHALLIVRRSSRAAPDSDESGWDWEDSDDISDAAIAMGPWGEVAEERIGAPVLTGPSDSSARPEPGRAPDHITLPVDPEPTADATEPRTGDPGKADNPPNKRSRARVDRKRLEPRVPQPLRAGLHRRAKRQAPSARGEREEAADLADVIVIWVCAKSGWELNGERLLAELSACGLLFYSDRVYRKTDPVGGGDWYTVANGLEPGTFDVSEPSKLATPHIAMLLHLGNVPDPAAAFEDMLGVAGHLAESLGGDLKDERRSDMSVQTVEYCRQRIREYKRTHLRA